MEIVKPGFKFIGEVDGDEILRKIEMAARTCYQSEGSSPDSHIKLVKTLIKNGHEAMLEHASISVLVCCDRGVSHELVRHRIASYAQESTRYVRYKNGIRVIPPINIKPGTEEYEIWYCQCLSAEKAYLDLLDKGVKPEDARSVLPHSVKTSIVITMNLREWRHFFKLRACGATGKPHPQMLEITVPMLNKFKEIVPIIFDDLEPMELPNLPN